MENSVWCKPQSPVMREQLVALIEHQLTVTRHNHFILDLPQ
jgi:hypothetical protein